ncbi:MAG: Flp family type IVb pilin [Gemmatimonadota bacterium]|nr:Flp family type IVb pilin [Gemmatimonadota bacterium]
MTGLLNRLWTDEAGQDLAEYALLLALIALVVITVVGTVGGTIRDTLWGPASDGLRGALE